MSQCSQLSEPVALTCHVSLHFPSLPCVPAFLFLTPQEGRWKADVLIQDQLQLVSRGPAIRVDLEAKGS